MGDNRDKEKLVPNDSIPFEVEKRSWAIGSCRLATVGDCVGFLLTPSDHAEWSTSLEVNFFSKELMEVDFNDVESIAHFMGDHGLLDCPYRRSSIPTLALNSLLPAVEQTNKARKDLQGLMAKDTSGFSYRFQRFVSLDEAVAVLRLLQDTVAMLFAWLDGTESHFSNVEYADWRNIVCFDFVNQNAGSKDMIAFNEPIEFLDEGEPWLGSSRITSSLTIAISNQIIETVADKAPWYRCKAEDCKIWFKRKRGTDAPRTNSEYCSATCSWRMRKHKQRDKIAVVVNQSNLQSYIDDCVEQL